MIIFQGQEAQNWGQYEEPWRGMGGCGDPRGNRTENEGSQALGLIWCLFLRQSLFGVGQEGYWGDKCTPRWALRLCALGLALVVLIVLTQAAPWCRGDMGSPFDTFGASDCDTVSLHCATERKAGLLGFPAPFSKGHKAPAFFPPRVLTSVL